ncbi:MAG: hypothetical protein QW393_04295 [Candidatus Micrarchaeaceae archaeon]
MPDGGGIHSKPHEIGRIGDSISRDKSQKKVGGTAVIGCLINAVPGCTVEYVHCCVQQQSDGNQADERVCIEPHAAGFARALPSR